MATTLPRNRVTDLRSSGKRLTVGELSATTGAFLRESPGGADRTDREARGAHRVLRIHRAFIPGGRYRRNNEGGNSCAHV